MMLFFSAREPEPEPNTPFMPRKTNKKGEYMRECMACQKLRKNQPATKVPVSRSKILPEHDGGSEKRRLKAGKITTEKAVTFCNPPSLVGGREGENWNETGASMGAILDKLFV